MNASKLLSTLRRCVPEFTPDDMFLDLPYVVFGGFSQFAIDRLREFGSDDPVVKRSFKFINDAFFDADPEMINVIETTFFEQLADDRALSRTAVILLEEAARMSFERVAETG